jgi:4-amino-4-deoxy-L-arabinose transferase-like glycosyltransferase
VNLPASKSTTVSSAELRLSLPLPRYWTRLALFGVLVVSAVLNFAGLSAEGYDNQYYAAAVRSMSQSWHNFFFTAFDPAGFVTIDKPPLGFWFQVASVKVFGFSGVALLIPQAAAGVLSVALLYFLVSRTFGSVAGLIAALALAITPIGVVTSRNNTVDSTLVLFVLLAAWAVLRAAETGRLTAVKSSTSSCSRLGCWTAGAGFGSTRLRNPYPLATSAPAREQARRSSQQRRPERRSEPSSHAVAGRTLPPSICLAWRRQRC